MGGSLAMCLIGTLARGTNTGLGDGNENAAPDAVRPRANDSMLAPSCLAVSSMNSCLQVLHKQATQLLHVRKPQQVGKCNWPGGGSVCIKEQL